MMTILPLDMGTTESPMIKICNSNEQVAFDPRVSMDTTHTTTATIFHTFPIRTRISWDPHGWLVRAPTITT
jgi:hypothetical protein